MIPLLSSTFALRWLEQVKGDLPNGDFFLWYKGPPKNHHKQIQALPLGEDFTIGFVKFFCVEWPQTIASGLAGFVKGPRILKTSETSGKV